SVQNSELIALYMNIFPICRPLMVFVRYWARYHELRGSFLIKNYALVLLVLTFLAKNDDVPKIQELQDLSTETFTINVWNAGFCKNVTKLREAIREEKFSYKCTWP